MGTRSILSNQMAFDNNGVIAPGALAYFYEAGTTTPKTVYQDGDETTPHEHPVEADGNGRWPPIFVPFGSYKETLTTAGGAAIGESTDEIPNPEPTDPADEVDANDIFQTGDIIFCGKNGTRPGFVRWNGRSIGNASSSATERANADCADGFAYLWDNFADAQCAVSGGRGATAAADFAANKRISLPDARSARLFGFDDMGNTAASLMGSAPVVNGSAILAGSIIGANTHVLTEAQLASHTHTGTTGTESQSHTHTGTSGTESATHTHTGTSGNQSADHTHSYSQPLFKNGSATGFNPTGGSGIWSGADQSTTTGVQSADHTHTTTTGTASATHTHTTTTGNASQSHTHTITTNATGSGSAHNNVSRGVPVTVLMKL